MADKNPIEKGRDAFEAKRETMRLMATDAEFRKLTTAVAVQTGEARHQAAVVDFVSGNATIRAINAYKVKRAVADTAKTEGRKANGDLLDAPVLPEAPISAKAPEAKVSQKSA